MRLDSSLYVPAPYGCSQEAVYVISDSAGHALRGGFGGVDPQSESDRLGLRLSHDIGDVLRDRLSYNNQVLGMRCLTYA